MKYIRVIAIWLIIMMLTAGNVLANTQDAATAEILQREFSDPNILAELQLLMKNGTIKTYIVYKSPFADDALQLEASIRFIYYYQTDVAEIVSINGVALKGTSFREYSGTIDRSKNSRSEDEYAKGKNLDMLESNQNAPQNNIPREEMPRTAYVLVDGVPLETDVAAFILNGRTMVPFRAIGEALNAEVGFNFINEGLRVVWAIRYHTKIDLSIGDYRIFKEGKHIFMDQAPVLQERRTFVPVRYIAELFDCKVDWEESTSTVKIYTRK